MLCVGDDNHPDLFLLYFSAQLDTCLKYGPVILHHHRKPGAVGFRGSQCIDVGAAEINLFIHMPGDKVG